MNNQRHIEAVEKKIFWESITANEIHSVGVTKDLAEAKAFKWKKIHEAQNELKQTQH